MSKAFGEELLFQRAEAGTLTPDEQRRLAKRARERLSKMAWWCEENVRLRAEIVRLRDAIRRLADQDATLSVCEGNVTVTMDATLTDAEREAVERQAAWLVSQAKNKSDIHSCDLLLQDATTLRGLLERLGGNNG